MTMQLVGIIDFNGQTHCIEHATTVASYRDEVYSVDPARECWCGKVIAGERPATVPPHGGYIVGDYVIADHAEFDSFDGQTFKVVALGYNLIGKALVYVVDITTMKLIQPRRCCFYPHELSYEDGSQPAR